MVVADICHHLDFCMYITCLKLIARGEKNDRHIYAYYPERYCNSDCMYIASVRMCIIIIVHIPVCDICISKYIHILFICIHVDYQHVYTMWIIICKWYASTLSNYSGIRWHYPIKILCAGEISIYSPQYTTHIQTSCQADLAFTEVTYEDFRHCSFMLLSKSSLEKRGFWIRFEKLPLWVLFFARPFFSFDVGVARLMSWLCQVHELSLCCHFTSAIATGTNGTREHWFLMVFCWTMMGV